MASGLSDYDWTIKELIDRAGDAYTMPRFSLKGLFYATTFVAVFAAVLNNPGGSVARMLTAQTVAMILLALCILSVRDIVRIKRAHRGRMAWAFPAVCFILLIWSTGQMIYAATQLKGD